ncbi:MAG: radical SAM protein [Clostridia bacterium]|nr:radical SAM protein [Clostridia bacterium]
MRHANVAIFIPHNGCKNKCSFCDQRNITGVKKQPTTQEVRQILQKAAIEIKNSAKNFLKPEIAFFGGSFTSIDRDYMISLLEVACDYLNIGAFVGIRISTRPDSIDDEIIKILKHYGVKTVELGAQSMDDEVLLENNRGHTANDVKLAAEKIKKAGINLGLQMMTGLYKSNAEKDKNTALEFIKLEPSIVRIYPTVVVKGTELEKLYNIGEYKPMSFEETINLCSELLLLFEKNNITVIRLGLHDSKELRENIVSGVFHPAFRELCESRLYYLDAINKIKEIELAQKCSISDVTVKINPKSKSKFVGQKKENLRKFAQLGYNIKIILEEKMKGREILVSR